MAALVASRSCQVAPKIPALDLRDDSVEMVGGRVRQAWKPPALEIKEILGDGLEPAGVDDQCAEHENRLVISRRQGRRWQSSKIPGFVDVQNVQ